MISEATGAFCVVESMRHPWKQFHWGFLSLHQLSFHWLFLSPQGLLALSNPCVTIGSSFVDDFWVNRGSLRCRIHASPVEAVSLIISEATWVFCAVESMHHPWQQFCWGFLKRQRLCFRWLFLSPEGLFALLNPCVTRVSSFVDDFLVHRGSFRCRIHASPVEAVLLIISE